MARTPTPSPPFPDEDVPEAGETSAPGMAPPERPMEARMLYKTMVLELLRQHPETYERLRRQRRLLPELERYATELRERHGAWTGLLAQAEPESGERQVVSAALEIALKELTDHFASGALSEAALPMSIDAAMQFHRPRSYESARRTVFSPFYTTPTVIATMHQALARLGVPGNAAADHPRRNRRGRLASLARPARRRRSAAHRHPLRQARGAGGRRVGEPHLPRPAVPALGDGRHRFVGECVGDIDANLGAPWIPESDIHAFAAEAVPGIPVGYPARPRDAGRGVERRSRSRRQTLGRCGLFVDEAQYFRNLETPTEMERVAGLQTGGSERAFDLYMKCR